MEAIEQEPDIKERKNGTVLLSSFANGRVQLDKEKGFLREGRRMRSRKESNAKRKKKNPPQRGMGVAQLEKLRLLEEHNMHSNRHTTITTTATLTKSDANFFHHFHHQPLLNRSSWISPPPPQPLPPYANRQWEITDLTPSYFPTHPNTSYRTLNLMHNNMDSSNLHLPQCRDRLLGHLQPQEEMLVPPTSSERSKELSSFQNFLSCSTPFPNGKSNSSSSQTKRGSCSNIQLKQHNFEMKQCRSCLPGATTTLSSSPSMNISSSEETETETETETEESPLYPSSTQMINLHNINYFQRNGLVSSTNPDFPLQKVPQKPLGNIQTSMLTNYDDHHDHDHGDDGNDNHSLGLSLVIEQKHDNASPWVCNRENNAHRFLPPHSSPQCLNSSSNDKPKVSLESGGGHIVLFGRKLFQQNPLNYPPPDLSMTSDIVESSSSRVTLSCKKRYSSTSKNGALDLTLKLSL